MSVLYQQQLSQYNHESFSESHKLRQGIEQLVGDVHHGRSPILMAPSQERMLDELTSLSQSVSKEFERLVVLGTGGSTLNPQSILGLKHLKALRAGNDAIECTFMDNIDPHTWHCLLGEIDFKKTCWLIISKSGSTMETHAQFLVLVKAYADKEILFSKRQLLVITQASASPILSLAESLSAEIIYHPQTIGGRFSAFTPVGALPAMIMGLDMHAFFRGGAEVVTDFVQAGIESKPAVGAGCVYHWVAKGYQQIVCMPYADRLEPFSHWLQQIYAESLGKKGKGLTPIRALGTLDQHSQLQLYLDGPDDKQFTFFCLDETAPVYDIALPKESSDASIFSKGHTLATLIRAECHATYHALKELHKPIRIFSIQEANEATLGALMMHMMIETIVLASLFEVDPYDQPAVERGKQIARSILETA